MVSQSQLKANKKYFKNNYTQIKLAMPKEEAEILDKYCKENNITKAGFIRSVIKDRIDEDLILKDEVFKRWVSEKWQEAKDDGVITYEMEAEVRKAENKRYDIFSMNPYKNKLLELGYISRDREGYYKTGKLHDTPENYSINHPSYY